MKKAKQNRNLNKRVIFMVTPELFERLERVAQTQGHLQSAILRAALLDMLDRMESNEEKE